MQDPTGLLQWLTKVRSPLHFHLNMEKGINKCSTDSEHTPLHWERIVKPHARAGIARTEDIQVWGLIFCKLPHTRNRTTNTLRTLYPSFGKQSIYSLPEDRQVPPINSKTRGEKKQPLAHKPTQLQRMGAPNYTQLQRGGWQRAVVLLLSLSSLVCSTKTILLQKLL